MFQILCFFLNYWRVAKFQPAKNYVGRQFLVFGPTFYWNYEKTHLASRRNTRGKNLKIFHDLPLSTPNENERATGHKRFNSENNETNKLFKTPGGTRELNYCLV